MDKEVVNEETLKNTISTVYEKILLIASIITALTGIVGTVSNFYDNASKLSPQTIIIGVSLLNLIVALLAFNKIKAQSLSVENEKIVKKFDIEGNDEEKTEIIKRTNLLVEQFVNKIQLYSISLAVLYAIFLLQSFSFISNNYNYLITLAENVSNLIGGIFLFLTFKVLYDTTLDEKYNSTLKYTGTITFIFLYIFFYIAFAKEINPTSVFFFKLLCGIFNGVFLALIFGRMLSMEYFFKDILWTGDFFRKFYYYGTIFLLPFYIVIQPLYSLFDFPVGNDQNIKQFIDLVKPTTLTIAFIGKGFFLLLIYKYIRYKWLHIYLYLVLNNTNIPKQLASKFAELHEKNNES